MNKLKSKIHVYYLLNYKEYANCENITGPCNATCCISIEDSVFNFIINLQKNNNNNNNNNNNSNSEIKYNLNNDKEIPNINIFDIEESTVLLSNKTLDEIIARFLLEASDYLSECLYSLVCYVLLSLRNCYNVIGWKFYYKDLINSKLYNKYISDVYSNNSNNNENKDYILEYYSTKLKLSSIDYCYKNVPNILNYFILVYLKDVNNSIDYVFCIIVINHFMDWMHIKKYINDRIEMNFPETVVNTKNRKNNNNFVYKDIINKNNNNNKTSETTFNNKNKDNISKNSNINKNSLINFKRNYIENCEIKSKRQKTYKKNKIINLKKDNKSIYIKKNSKFKTKLSFSNKSERNLKVKLKQSK